MQVNLFSEGLNLLFLGMGFVFIFLVFLVFAVRAMSNLLTRWFPEPPPVTATPKPAAPHNNDNQVVAVITAAIHHRKIQQNSL